MSEEINVVEELAGVSREKMLITTDSIEEFSQEISTSFEDESFGSTNQKNESNINRIQGKTENEEDSTKASGSESGSQDQLETDCDENEHSGGVVDYLHDADWLNKPEQIFVLSSSGKPIYTLHGCEDKLVTLFGVMQALVSVVQANQDVIMSIHAANAKFVFLVKGPLILVAVSRRNISVQQIQLQLT